MLRGHAVRALYLASGALDVAVETDDAELEEAVGRQWSSTVARRAFITGGRGSHHQDEAFGADYELPPDRAYAETCAAIASDMLSWRLLLRSGETAHADLIERTLLNAVLPAIRADGRASFSTSTLQQRADGVEPVHLSLPMTARFVSPHPRIDAVRGQVALERGPFVPAIESVDLPEGLDTEHLAVDRSVEPVVTPDGARVALAAVSGEGGGMGLRGRIRTRRRALRGRVPALLHVGEPRTVDDADLDSRALIAEYRGVLAEGRIFG